MKRLMVVAVSLLMVLSFGITYAEKDGSTKYEVRLSIVYNAVDRDEAISIVKQAIKLHDKACTVDVKVQKAGRNLDVTDGGSIFFSEDMTDKNMGTIEGCYTLENKAVLK